LPLAASPGRLSHLERRPRLGARLTSARASWSGRHCRGQCGYLCQRSVTDGFNEPTDELSGELGQLILKSVRGVKSCGDRHGSGPAAYTDCTSRLSLDLDGRRGKAYTEPRRTLTFT
jgi:hypothetical protein